MSDQLNPDDFVITRRRKRYKFAKFANATNCYELADWCSKSSDRQSTIDVVEIGAGTGFFSVELATRNPETNYLAIDVKADRLQRGAYSAIEQGVDNVQFIRALADKLDEIVPSNSLRSIWVAFADPYPRRGSSRRRMTHQRYLDIYARALSPKGRLLIKHDDDQFFNWTLEQLVAAGWQIDELSFNLHDSDLDDEYKTLTSYEERWLAEERVTKFVAARLPIK